MFRIQLLIAVILFCIGSGCKKSKHCTNDAHYNVDNIDENNVELYNYSSDSAYYKIPKYFTPNGDGINDILTSQKKYVRSVEISIYNKCNDKIFSATVPDINWEGNYNNDPLRTGSYHFKLELTWDHNGASIKEEGDIDILRYNYRIIFFSHDNEKFRKFVSG